MSIAQSMLAEFEIQLPITRRFVERLPQGKLTWKPHDKSMTAGQLAFHLASVPGRLIEAVRQNPMQAPDFAHFPQPASTQEILDALNESAATVRELLPQFNDAAMAEIWRLKAGDREVLAQPRGLFLRDVMFSHLYQHRGQFSVYLRILDIPVPASWGPSADEPPLFLQQELQAAAV